MNITKKEFKKIKKQVQELSTMLPEVDQTFPEGKAPKNQLGVKGTVILEENKRREEHNKKHKLKEGDKNYLKPFNMPGQDINPNKSYTVELNTGLKVNHTRRMMKLVKSSKTVEEAWNHIDNYMQNIHKNHKDNA